MKINNLSIGIINLSVSNILSVYEGCRKAGYNVEVIDKKIVNLNMISLLFQAWGLLALE